jgi:alkanesulfonate monooxygenase SsuD/methylene tetrahydromethanopterin reductase-like flavin-dependent oxidoreductase (luciferase family)
VVPHRPAVLTAKLLSTIDFLSKGRLTLGIGVGWCREEFEDRCGCRRRSS